MNINLLLKEFDHIFSATGEADATLFDACCEVLAGSKDVFWAALFMKSENALLGASFTNQQRRKELEEDIKKNRRPESTDPYNEVYLYPLARKDGESVGYLVMEEKKILFSFKRKWKDVTEYLALHLTAREKAILMYQKKDADSLLLTREELYDHLKDIHRYQALPGKEFLLLLLRIHPRNEIDSRSFGIFLQRLPGTAYAIGKRVFALIVEEDYEGIQERCFELQDTIEAQFSMAVSLTFAPIAGDVMDCFYTCERMVLRAFPMQIICIPYDVERGCFVSDCEMEIFESGKMKETEKKEAVFEDASVKRIQEKEPEESINKEMEEFFVLKEEEPTVEKKMPVSGKKKRKQKKTDEEATAFVQSLI